MESAPCSRKTDKAMEISIRFNRQMDYSCQPEAGYHTPQWNANIPAQNRAKHFSPYIARSLAVLSEQKEERAFLFSG